MNSVRMIATVTAVGTTGGLANFSGSYNRNITCWPNGVIGYSFTRFDPAQAWSVTVYSNVMGSSQVIAGVVGVGSTAAGFMPITTIAGTTTVNFIGIPTPVQVVVKGSTAIAGLTGVVVVTAALYSPT